MKMHLSHINITFLMLFLVGNLQAQQIYPVQVNGMLIPPHSLVLSDYSFNRAQDVLFFLTLQDPVENSRMVKLRLTILHNGTEIITTNPNYNPPPIILEKDNPLMIDGTDLAGYLDQNNLINLSGQQTGGLLPEGFNSFCLEVIDLERNVPISDRICVSGFFELSDPPLLNTPICHEVLPWTETQNIIFNWLPQHLSSINPPLDVQYEFKLVQVLPDQNPNDAFLFSAPIYEETVFTPSLLYLEDAPLLEPGVVYAWRVRAFDGQGGDLFSNNGYSEVCTFSFLEEEVIDPNIAYTCNDGLCYWPGNLSQLSLSGGLNIGDEVKINHFTMKLTAIQTSGADQYQGEGTIFIPFLSSKLKVTFSDIKVNDKNRVYAGQVFSAAPQNTALIPPLFDISDSGDIDAQTNLDSGFSDANALALMEYFSSTNPPPNLISLLDGNTEESALAIHVPIGIDQGTESSEFLSSIIVITGIKFDPWTAELNAVLATRQDENGEWIKFGTKNLCVQPGGLTQSGAPKLDLLTDVELYSQGLKVKLLGLKDGQENTTLSWNCEGLEQFELKGLFEFNKELVVPENDASGTVTATFSTSADRLFDFMTPVDGVGDFVMQGMESFPIQVGNEVWLDFSAEENPSAMVFPAGFPTEDANPGFKGIWISQAGMGLPTEFQNSSAQSVADISGGILYDRNGISGLLSGENLIALENGNLGGWPYSLDSVRLSILGNALTAGDFQGDLRLPIMNDEEVLPYQGSFVISQNSNAPGLTYEFNPVPGAIVDVSLLRADIQFDENGQINVGTADGQFLPPKADLSGQMVFSIDSADPGFAPAQPINEDYDALQLSYESMGLAGWQKSLTTDGLQFEHLKIDLEAEDKFQITNISPFNANLNFLNFGSDLSQARLSTLDDEQLTLMGLTTTPNVKPLGLGFELNLAPDVLGILAPPLIFTILINEDNSDPNAPVFSFAGLDIMHAENDIIEGLTVDCANNLDPIIIDGNPVLHSGSVEGSFSTLQLGYFTLQPAFPLSQDINGTISGRGTVEVPVLGPFKNLNVEFTNVKVDENGRIVAGQVKASGADGLFNATNLEGVMSEVQTQVDGMVSGANSVFDLPIVLGMNANGQNERDQGLIIMGLVFSPTKASVQAKIIVDTGNKKYIEFAAEGLNLVPNGIASFDLGIGLAKDFPFQPIAALEPLIFKKYVPNTGEGSFIACDCDGFVQFQLEGTYEFPEDQLLSLDDQGEPDGTVTAGFTFNTTAWGEFTGKLTGLGDFTFSGLEDYFSMSVSDVYLDFSKLKNEPEDIQFPENYYDPTFGDDWVAWQGIYMPEFTVNFPQGTFLSESGRSPSLICENLLFDRQGVTFSFFGKNLLDANINGWGFSLDSLGISVLTNTLESGGLAGTVNMPLLDGALNYGGEMLKDEEGFWYMNIFPLNEATISIDPMYAYFQMSPSSTITLATVPDPTRPGRRKFKPYADLYGKIGLDISKADFMTSGDSDIVDAITSLENTLGAEFNFEPPAISLYGLKINHPDLEPGKTFGLDYYEMEGGISIGDFELSLKQLHLLEEEITVKNKTYPGVGLQFRLSVPLVTFNMGVWAKKDTLTDKYSFGKFQFDIKTAKFECNPNPDSVALFTVGGESVLVPFLDTTFPVVLNNQGSYSTVDGQGDGFVSFPISLKQTLEDLGNKLPFNVVETFEDAGFDIGDSVPDFNITGITFFSDGTATMNADLNIEVDGTALNFVASMPIHPDGIFFNGVKLGLGTDMGF
ncbi:MAG: hypothetical protein DHS20C18_50790 [Saprospiraceae bacterium]|nr:MAG: hypothetical protein DHS20C18_50790 [Saprospiraceae bacterium]